jgi:hypothetical protein
MQAKAWLLAGVLVMTGLGLAVPARADPATLHVPADFATIQAAVDAAQPGDTVLIAPGTYHESVGVHTAGITIRGADRASVVLDGGTTQPTCNDGFGVGVDVRADGVTVSDLTLRDYSSYGVSWYAVDGFYGHRLTAERACVYGLYAIGSAHGEIAFSEASGSGDSGLYVGEVDDCVCVLHHNDVHGNMMGYSGTRAGRVVMRDNWFHDNGVGVVPNTLLPDAGEAAQTLLDGGSPALVQCCMDFHDNLVEDNNNRNVTPHGFTETIHVPIGTGVEIAGGSGNLVYDNVIRGHARWGMAVHWLFAPPDSNVVHDNVFAGNAGYDVWWDEWGVGNCWGHNQLATSDPSPLPECGLLPSVGVPSAVKDAHLALLALGYLVGMDEPPI